MLVTPTAPNPENTPTASLPQHTGLYPQLHNSDVICHPSYSFVPPSLSPSVGEQEREQFIYSQKQDSPTRVSLSQNLLSHSMSDTAASTHVQEGRYTGTKNPMHYSDSDKGLMLPESAFSGHNESSRENSSAVSNEMNVISHTSGSRDGNIPPSPRLPPKSPGKPSASSFALTQKTSSSRSTSTSKHKVKSFQKKEKPRSSYWEDLDLFGKEKVLVSGPERPSIASEYVIASPSMPEVFQAKSAKITSPIFPSRDEHVSVHSRCSMDRVESPEVRVNPLTDDREGNPTLPPGIVPEIVDDVEFDLSIGFEQTLDVDLSYRAARVPLPYAINITVVGLHGEIRPVTAKLEKNPDFVSNMLLSVISEAINFEGNGSGGYEDIALTFWAAPDRSDEESSASLLLTVVDDEGNFHETVLKLCAEGTEPVIAVKRPNVPSRVNSQDTNISFDKGDLVEEEIVTVWNETTHEAPLLIAVAVTETGGGVYSIGRDKDESCECIPTTIPSCGAASFVVRFNRPEEHGRCRFYLGTVVIKLGRMTLKHDDHFQNRDYNLAFDHVISLRATSANSATIHSESESISQLHSIGTSEHQYYSEQTRGFDVRANRDSVSEDQFADNAFHAKESPRQHWQDDENTMDTNVNSRVGSVSSREDTHVVRFEPLDVIISTGLEPEPEDIECGPLYEGIFSLLDPVEWVSFEPDEEAIQLSLQSGTADCESAGESNALPQTKLSCESAAGHPESVASRRSFNPTSAPPSNENFSQKETAPLQDAIRFRQSSGSVPIPSTAREASFPSEHDEPLDPTRSLHSSNAFSVPMNHFGTPPDSGSNQMHECTPLPFSSFAIPSPSAAVLSSRESGVVHSGNSINPQGSSFLNSTREEPLDSRIEMAAKSQASAQSSRSETANYRDHGSNGVGDNEEKRKNQSHSSYESMATKSTWDSNGQSSSPSQHERELVQKQHGIFVREEFPSEALPMATPYGKVVGYGNNAIALRTTEQTPFGKLVGYNSGDMARVSKDPAMRTLEFLEGFGATEQPAGPIESIRENTLLSKLLPSSRQLEGLTAVLRSPTKLFYSKAGQNAYALKPHGLPEGPPSSKALLLKSSKTQENGFREACISKTSGENVQRNSNFGGSFTSEPPVNGAATDSQTLPKSSSTRNKGSNASSKTQEVITQVKPKLRLPRKMRPNGAILASGADSVVIPLCSGSESDMRIKIRIRSRTRSPRPVSVEPSSLVLQPAERAKLIVKRQSPKEGKLSLSLVCHYVGNPTNVTSYEIPLAVEELLPASGGPSSL